MTMCDSKTLKFWSKLVMSMGCYLQSYTVRNNSNNFNYLALKYLNI